MSTEHALVLASAQIRRMLLPNHELALATYIADVESMRAGKMPVVPFHQIERAAETALCIGDVQGHEVFAAHEGVVFAVHAAILKGLGAAAVFGIRNTDDLLFFAPQLVEQGFSVVATRADDMSSGVCQQRVLLASAGTKGYELIEVPAEALRLGSQPQSTSLQEVVRDVGLTLDLPEPFGRPMRTPGFQILIIDPRQVPREASLIELRRADATLLRDTRLVPSGPLPNAIGLSASAQARVSEFSREMGVFDPLAGR